MYIHISYSVFFKSYWFHENKKEEFASALIEVVKNKTVYIGFACFVLLHAE